MHRLLIILTIGLFSCGAQQVKLPEQPSDIEPLTKFFSVFEKDLVNTARVISEQELVKNLTHLQKMNFGGQKYYPLERESLTKMIRELSSYEYAECIVLNHSGTVIYSMYDDSIFSKKAESYTNSLGILYKNGRLGPFIFDVHEFPPMSKQYVVFFAMPIPGDDNDGVLIAAIKAESIAKTAGIKGVFVDEEGIIRLSADHDKILTPAKNFRGKNNEKTFRYLNIEWYLSAD
ncbi:MAG TPA: cache domain-containing protein [Spirochaetota bacterium]